MNLVFCIPIYKIRQILLQLSSSTKPEIWRSDKYISITTTGVLDAISNNCNRYILLQIYLHTFLIYYYEYNADAQILSLYEFDEREA